MRVSIVFQTSGADRTVGEIRQIQQALNRLGATSANIRQQNQKVGVSVAELAFKF
jgi:peptidoglycan hydrolase-like protein with peptidoglycan-binding domain